MTKSVKWCLQSGHPLDQKKRMNENFWEQVTTNWILRIFGLPVDDRLSLKVVIILPVTVAIYM